MPTESLPIQPTPFQPMAEPDAFLANQNFLRALARGLIHDAAQAEDLLQDTWLAWRERRPAGLGEPRAWLTRVLQNRAKNARREELRRAERERLAARGEAGDELARETLEVQAEVVTLLRALDEPLQSALVLRYFHGLSPAEIAARSGASVNTVKSRLTRGLARLREELDRLHASDRRAWSLCLLPLARAEGGLAEPEPARPPWLALAAGVCALAVVVVLVVFVWTQPRTTTEPAALFALAGVEPALAAEPELAAPAALEPAEQRAPVVPAVAPSQRVVVEWPQFARNAAHDGFDPKLDDKLRSPAILWHVADTFGQPTLSGGDLYSGGRGLFRIDATSGLVLARVLGPETAAERTTTEPDPAPLTVAAAPALTSELVLARRMQDGGVTAFDRSLSQQVWSWTPETPCAGQFPGCLAGGLYVCAANERVVALRVADGKPAWSFEAGSPVNMVPAAAGGHAFFGAESGAFWSLNLSDGGVEWRVETGGQLGWTSPVVVKDRVVFADRGGAAKPAAASDDNDGDTAGSREGELRAYATKDGKELWHTAFGATGFSTPGVGPGYVLGGFGKYVSRFDLAKGHIDQGHNVRTGINAFGSPTVVGDSLVFGNLDGNLYVHDLERGKLVWRFHLPADKQAHDFVHAGERIFLATTDGLYCLGDNGSNRRLPPEFVLESTSPLVR